MGEIPEIQKSKTYGRQSGVPIPDIFAVSRIPLRPSRKELRCCIIFKNNVVSFMRSIILVVTQIEKRLYHFAIFVSFMRGIILLSDDCIRKSPREKIVYHCEISSRTNLLKIANIWSRGDMRCRSWVLTRQIDHKWSVLIGSHHVWWCSDPRWLYIQFSSKSSAIKRLGLTPECIGFQSKITKSVSGK